MSTKVVQPMPTGTQDQILTLLQGRLMSTTPLTIKFKNRLLAALDLEAIMELEV